MKAPPDLATINSRSSGLLTESLVVQSNTGSNTASSSLARYVVSKYFDRSKGLLHEAIILAGKSTFVTFNARRDRIEMVTSIQEPTRMLVPPSKEECVYDPYEFTSLGELRQYKTQAEQENPGSLYKMAVKITSRFIDQSDPDIVKLVAADTVWSYFQDRYPTTHYLWLVGDNGTGKSSIGDTYSALGYRVIMMTDATGPNYLRALGTIEPGQCTLVVDEADDSVSKDGNLRRVLKTGYQFSGKVPRINLRKDKQEFYHAYCFKIIISEELPSHLRKAKGVMDRAFVVYCVPGNPDSDIKEVKKAGNLALQQLLDELVDFRKLMLAYRLIHINDPLVELDIGLAGRNKELCKPLIQLFYNTEAQAEVEKVLQKFVDDKNRTKLNMAWEAAILQIIDRLIDHRGTTTLYLNRDIWREMKNTIPADEDTAATHKIVTDSGDIIYRTDVSKIAEAKLGAVKDRRNNGTILIFDKDKLKRIKGQYETKAEQEIRKRPIDSLSVKTVKQVLL